MDANRRGTLILKSVGPENEAAVTDFLAGLFKKATPEKIRSFVQKAPTVLTRNISAAQAGKVVARLAQLGAAADFKDAAPSPPPAAATAAAPPEAAVSKPPDSARAAVSETVIPPTLSCSQCGRPQPEDEMLSYDGMWVCAACKPGFIQKLKEGETLAGELRYAGFWIRGGAKIIDAILIFILGMLVTLLANLLGGIVGARSPAFHMITANLLKVVAAAAFATWFVGRYAATPGKMACGLKIILPDGAAVSYPRALGRYFAEWISSMIFGIGYIMAAFDGEKRALHDRICGTRVVKK